MNNIKQPCERTTMKLNWRRVHIRNARGFSMVEVIVTVSITTLFIVAAVQLFLAIEFGRIMALRQSVAYGIALTNLQKFSSRSSITATCSAEIPLALTNESSASLDIDKPIYNPALSQLPTPVTQTVKAYPVEGCNGTAFVSSILRIVSSVTYSGTITVSVATYVQ